MALSPPCPTPSLSPSQPSAGDEATATLDRDTERGPAEATGRTTRNLVSCTVESEVGLRSVWHQRASLVTTAGGTDVCCDRPVFGRQETRASHPHSWVLGEGHAPTTGTLTRSGSPCGCCPRCWARHAGGPSTLAWTPAGPDGRLLAEDREGTSQPPQPELPPVPGSPGAVTLTPATPQPSCLRAGRHQRHVTPQAELGRTPNYVFFAFQ